MPLVALDGTTGWHEMAYMALGVNTHEEVNMAEDKSEGHGRDIVDGIVDGFIPQLTEYGMTIEEALEHVSESRGSMEVVRDGYGHVIALRSFHCYAAWNDHAWSIKNWNPIRTKWDIMSFIRDVSTIDTITSMVDDFGMTMEEAVSHVLENAPMEVDAAIEKREYSLDLSWGEEREAKRIEYAAKLRGVVNAYVDVLSRYEGDKPDWNERTARHKAVLDGLGLGLKRKDILEAIDSVGRGDQDDGAQ